VATVTDVAGSGGTDVSEAWPDADTALVALFTANYAGLLGLAVVLSDDRFTAEDLVQDAFARMCRHWHRLRDPGRALAYLRACVVSIANTAKLPEELRE